MKERFEGLADAARFVDWRVAGRDGSGIPKGGCFANLITLQNGDSCTALGQEIGATDPNYATADNDGVPIEWPCRRNVSRVSILPSSIRTLNSSRL